MSIDNYVCVKDEGYAQLLQMLTHTMNGVSRLFMIIQWIKPMPEVDKQLQLPLYIDGDYGLVGPPELGHARPYLLQHDI